MTKKSFTLLNLSKKKTAKRMIPSKIHWEALSFVDTVNCRFLPEVGLNYRPEWPTSGKNRMLTLFENYGAYLVWSH